MSHIEEIKLHVTDLDALIEAAELDCGLVYHHSQETYKWYGTWVGGGQMPEGYTKEDAGHCLHAFSVKHNDRAYEIGILERRDGKPGYCLVWDFWKRGYGLEDAIGTNGDKLLQAYAYRRQLKHYRKKGFKMDVDAKPTLLADGSMVVDLYR